VKARRQVGSGHWLETPVEAFGPIAAMEKTFATK